MVNDEVERLKSESQPGYSSVVLVISWPLHRPVVGLYVELTAEKLSCELIALLGRRPRGSTRD